MRAYVVRQGDYLARIAWQAGVSENDIWEHDENAHRRENPACDLAASEVAF